MKQYGMKDVCEQVGCKYGWLQWMVAKNKLVDPTTVGSVRLFTLQEIKIISEAFKTRTSTTWNKQGGK